MAMREARAMERQVLYHAIAVVAMGMAVVGQAGAVERPNILLVTTDQQRTDTLSCYGSSFAHSPHLDHFAAQGVQFLDAYASAPVCAPSRTSLLLGVHVPNHLILENGMNFHSDVHEPFSDILRDDVGYTTALIGKAGFTPIPESLALHDSWLYTSKFSSLRSSSTPAAGFLETVIVNRSMQWITKYSKPPSDTNSTAKPWFLHVSMLSPHGPNTLPRDWVPPVSRAEVLSGTVLPPINYVEGDEDRLPSQTRKITGIDDEEETRVSDLDRTTIDMHRHAYYSQAAFVDEQFGRLIQFLDSHDNGRLTSSTLVIFTSDHGSMLFDHGVLDKHTLHRQALRVPLIMRFPGVLPAGKTANFASLLDVTTSILSAAGAVVPFAYQGMDLIQPISTGLPSPRTAIVATDFMGYTVVSSHWKLVYFPEYDEGQLFDPVKDPLERENLWNDADCRSVRDDLLHALLRWRSRQVPISALHHELKFTLANQGLRSRLKLQHRVTQEVFKLRGVAAELDLQDAATSVPSRVQVQSFPSLTLRE